MFVATPRSHQASSVTASPATAAPQPHPASTDAPIAAPGATGTVTDAALVQRALDALRSTPTGARVVDRLLAVRAKVAVLSDGEFAAVGRADARAFYDPATQTMSLRRSDLLDVDRSRVAAVALAHEGTHLLDDVGRVAASWLARTSATIASAGGAGTSRGGELARQAAFELTMIREARAFTVAGQVARDLGVALPADDPTVVAARGGNDPGTYAAVWQRLLESPYNAQARTAPVTAL